LLFCCVPVVVAWWSAEANLLYGRGMLAGIDRREQKKQAATVEADMLKKLRSAAGIVETRDMVAQAREKEARADKYDNFDMSVSTCSNKKTCSRLPEACSCNTRQFAGRKVMQLCNLT
jgi:ATP-dependent RNA helicase DDX23/PRP28